MGESSNVKRLSLFGPNTNVYLNMWNLGVARKRRNSVMLNNAKNENFEAIHKYNEKKLSISGLDTGLWNLGVNRRRDSVMSNTYRFKPKDLIQTDYSKYKNYEKIHKHDHSNLPHMHNPDDIRCISNISGYDSHRHKRYYFTTEKTPCRIYIVYGGTALSLSAFVDETQDGHQRGKIKYQIKNVAEYQRLSENQLKQLNISKKFFDEAKNMIYCRDTNSFIPMQSLIRSSSRSRSKTPFSSLL